MNDELQEKPNDRFADFAERIAAQARQLLRAIRAEDSKAVEETLFYLRDFLVKVLGSHLLDDPRWDSKGQWLEGLGVAAPETLSSGLLRFRDELTWVTRDQQYWYVEPFEFELELCPVTSAFQRYTFRFGDLRPLAEKELTSPPASSGVVGPGDNGWAFIFHVMKGEEKKRNEKGDSVDLG